MRGASLAGDGGRAARFLRDLCTRRELTEMAHRWAVAQLLDRGLPYREISEQVGASTATVTRINEWLHHGTGGYRLVLDRLGAGSRPPVSGCSGWRFPTRDAPGAVGLAAA